MNPAKVHQNGHVDEDNRGAIFQPQEAVNSALALIDERLDEQERGEVGGVTLNIPELQTFIRPVYPGELWIICGLSRNGKSFFMKKVLYEETMRVYEMGPSNRCTVIMTWEESAEVLAMSWLAKLSGISSTKMLKGGITRQEFDQLGTVAVKVKQFPIYIIGPSVRRGKDGIRRKPDLSMAGVERALNWILNKQGKDPVLLVGDYAQRVPQGNESKLNLHIRNVVDWFKDVSFWAGAPAMLAGQANQKIEDRALPMPRLYDFEWSANAGYTTDVYTSVWMPKTTFRVGERIDKFDAYYDVEVTPTLQFVGWPKQKGDRDGYIFPLELQPDKLLWRLAPFYYSSDYARDARHSKPTQLRWY